MQISTQQAAAWANKHRLAGRRQEMHDSFGFEEPDSDRDASMSAIDSLPNAINNLASEKDEGLIRSHVRDVVAGVKELVELVKNLEERIVALEKELMILERE